MEVCLNNAKALRMTSAGCFWGEYHACGIFQLFGFGVKESEWFRRKKIGREVVEI